MGGISHTHDGTRLNDRMWIDYILTRQAHRPRVQDVEVAPQPSAPAKVDSDHNILYFKVQVITLRPTNNTETVKTPRVR